MNTAKARVRKTYELDLDPVSLGALNNIATSQSVPVERVIAVLIETSVTVKVFLSLRKRENRRAYMQGYYKKFPEKFGRKKPQKIIARVRVQDRIEKSFRLEDERLNNIKYAFCQNAQCPKTNKKYVSGSGVILDFDGANLYFCSHRCEQAFLKNNEPTR